MKNDPVRILLIEDNPGDARLVQEALKEAGATRFNMDWVQDLAGGMEALQKDPADVILLDLNLPDSTGIATFNRVHDQAPQIPLILLTGQDDEELAGKMAQEGAEDFIVKGRMDGNLLARSIRYAIERKQAEEQLKLLKYSIDTAPDAAYWLDPEGCFLYINETGCQTLGYGRNELLQKHVSLVSPRATPGRWAQVWKDLRKKKKLTIESVHRRKDGSEFQVEITSVYVKFGEKEYCNGFARDISERKQAEEERQQSEILFRTLFELSPDAIMLIDPHDPDIRSRIIDCNAAACRMNGYQREELIGQSIEIVNESPYSDVGEIAYLDKIRTDGSVQLEVLHRHKSGAVFPVEVSTTIIKVGERELLIGIDRDISERKQAEQAQRQSELQFRALFELSPDAIMLIDPHHPDISWPILDCNETACRMNGYRRDELIGQSIDLLNLAPGSRKERIAYMQQLREAGNLHVESFHRHKNGSMFPIEISTTVIKVGERELIIGIDRDITERKSIEDQLKESEEQFRSFIEQSSEGVVLLDEKGAVIGWNQAQAQITGMPSRQVLGKPFWKIQYQLLPLELRAVRSPDFFKEAMLDASKTGKFPTAGKALEAVICTPEGEIKSILQSSFPIKTEKGYRIGSVVRDITERKRAEEDLQASQAAERQFSERLALLSEITTELSKAKNLDMLYRRTVELGRERLDFDRLSIWLLDKDDKTMMGTFGVDVEGRITDERKERFTIGDDFLHSSELQGGTSLRKRTDAPLALNGQVVGQGTHITAGLWDGDTMIGYISLDNLLRQRPFSDQDCEIIRLYATAVGHLISLKRAETTLRISEASLEAVLGSTADGILAVGIENEVLYANERFAEMWKIPPEIIASRDNATLLQYVLDELIDPESFQQKVQKLHKSGKDSFDTLYFKDGRIFDRVSRPMLQGKDLRGRVWSFRDVSETRRMQEKLEEERTLLRTLIDQIPDLVYVKDTQGRKILSNISDWQASGGKSMEDVIGKTDFELYPPELAEDFFAVDRKVIDSGISILNQEELGMDALGNPVRLLSSKVPLRDGQGKITGLVGIGRDITERKQAEIERQTLLEIMQGLPNANNLQEYLRLVHHAVGKAIFAENFFVILKNKTTGLFEEVYSVDQYDAPSQPSLLEKSICAFVFRTGEALLMNPMHFTELKARGEVELVGADSKSWLGVPLTTSRETIGVMAVQDYDMEGRYSEHEKEFLVSIAGQIAQLVERKRAEENLHALFMRHEALLAAIPEIVMEVNNDKVYTWANQAGREFFGEDVLGREASFYFKGEQTVYQEVQPLFNGNGSTIYLESWQRRKDGQKRLLAWWCQVLKDGAGNVTGALSSARDITGQKLVEEQINKQMAELKRWYDLTLDRESRSLELKHEVNELLHRLNEPARYASTETEA